MATNAAPRNDHLPWGVLESSTDGINGKGRRGDGGSSRCLTNQQAYFGAGCCAGACGDTYANCFDCPTSIGQDQANYGGPSCFRAGSCIARTTPLGSCAAPSVKQVRGESEYGGWCVCPEGSFCRGDGCNTTTARGQWNPDEVSVRAIRVFV